MATLNSPLVSRQDGGKLPAIAGSLSNFRYVLHIQIKAASYAVYFDIHTKRLCDFCRIVVTLFVTALRQIVQANSPFKHHYR
jgi:hypothetical protein